MSITTLKKEDFDSTKIREYHEQFMSTMNLPAWIYEYPCIQCHEPMGLPSLREIGLKLNAQHIANFFINVCCQHCSYGYELHIENKCKTLDDFISLLQSKKQGEKNEYKFIGSHEIDKTKNNLLLNLFGNVAE
jgi:hypothetical protein